VSPFSAAATAPPASGYYPVAPASPNMDPYATAGATQPTLFPQDPYFSSDFVSAPMAAMTKFRQDIRFDYHWFLGHGERELGINDLDFSATFAIPFLKNPNTPLLVTPGFGLQLWEGPVSVLSTPVPNDPSAADLPAKTYGGYIDAAWKPMISQTIGGDLSARIGLYSDFTTTTTKSIRLTGAAYGVLSYSPSFQIKAGIMYINRLQIKILPAGGIIWKPTPDFECQILFPNPKIRKKWRISAAWNGGFTAQPTTAEVLGPSNARISTEFPISKLPGKTTLSITTTFACRRAWNSSPPVI
jgi:hypothetical protein